MDGVPFKRVIPENVGRKTLQGYAKADSSTLPVVTLTMLVNYCAQNKDLFDPELRHEKTDV